MSEPLDEDPKSFELTVRACTAILMLLLHFSAYNLTSRSYSLLDRATDVTMSDNPDDRTIMLWTEVVKVDSAVQD